MRVFILHAAWYRVGQQFIPFRPGKVLVFSLIVLSSSAFSLYCFGLFAFLELLLLIFSLRFSSPS